MGLNCLFALSLAWAAKPDKAVYPAQRIASAGVERIEILGLRGQLRLVGSAAKSYRLNVGHSQSRLSEDWNLVVEHRGSVLVIELSNSAYGTEWRHWVKHELWPEFDIQLEGPAKPTVVSWREGSLSYQNWNANLDTSFLSGDVRIEGGSGRQNLQAVNARVQVRHFHGDLSLKGERGLVDLFSLSGRVHLNWLRGPITLTQVDSNTQIETELGQVSVRGGRGEWRIQSPSGQVRIQDFKGHLKGHGESTRWIVRGRSQGDIELQSASGSVDVRWPASAHVFLTSKAGQIHSPYPLQDRDGQRVAEGKNAAVPQGQVFVRTETGDIGFKY